MRYLVLADIHSNLEALWEILRKTEDDYDEILVCGDVVGYNANPNEVIDVLRNFEAVSVMGNHDRAALVPGDTTHFNSWARDAILWTRRKLTYTSLEWLNALPTGPLEISPTIQLVHGSILDESRYIMYPLDALRDLSVSEKRLTFFGHTHYQTAINETGEEPTGVWWSAYQYLKQGKWIINPGSVGQPRDGDPRTAYAIFDTKGPRVKFFRVDYDYRTTQKKIIDAGLPAFLAKRLGRN